MERAVGEAFEYSNTGYVLLAGLLERVYGRPFEELMMTEVFGPRRTGVHAGVELVFRGQGLAAQDVEHGGRGAGCGADRPH